VQGDDVAARLGIRLRQLAEEAAGPDDTVIKSLGDAVMCHSPEPVIAPERLSRLFLVGKTEHLFPRLRGGRKMVRRSSTRVTSTGPRSTSPPESRCLLHRASCS
jgi:hypothetical protein